MDESTLLKFNNTYWYINCRFESDLDYKLKLKEMIKFENFKLDTNKDIYIQLKQIEEICNIRRAIIKNNQDIDFDNLLLSNQDVLYRLKYGKRKN